MFLLVLGLIDFYTMRLPDGLVIPLLLLGLLSAFFQQGHPNWQGSLVSAFGAGGVFWFVAMLHPQGMGYGDAKFIGALGAWLGFPNIVLAIFIASLMGSIFGVVTIFARKGCLKQQIPFGPYLSFGACIALFEGEKIFDLILACILR